MIDQNYDWGDVHTNRKKIWEDQPRKPRIDVAAPLLLLAQNVFLEKNRRVFAQWTFHPQFDQHLWKKSGQQYLLMDQAGNEVL